MAGIIDSYKRLRESFRKTKPVEVFGIEKIPQDAEKRRYIERVVIVNNTWMANAEKIAFRRIRRLARVVDSNLICYVDWSGANPDFMDGTERKPHDYSVEARLYI